MKISDAIEPPAAMVDPRPQRSGRKKGGLLDTGRFLLILFLVALLLRSFVVAPFSIPSGSMLPRLMIGDVMFVAKWPYGYSRFTMPFGIGNFEGRLMAAEPSRGDVVVFRLPGGEDDYVKRLIGLPGDTIQMRQGVLVLNGKEVPRVRIADYLMPMSPNSPCRTVDPRASRIIRDEAGRYHCAYARYRETLPGGRSYDTLDQVAREVDDTATFTVPVGHYFVMGDNRDDSEDSRIARTDGGVGMLPADHLIGRALITIYSTDGTGDWLKPWTWRSAARWDRLGETF